MADSICSRHTILRSGTRTCLLITLFTSGAAAGEFQSSDPGRAHRPSITDMRSGIDSRLWTFEFGSGKDQIDLAGNSTSSDTTSPGEKGSFAGTIPERKASRNLGNAEGEQSGVVIPENSQPQRRSPETSVNPDSAREVRDNDPSAESDRSHPKTSRSGKNTPANRSAQDRNGIEERRQFTPAAKEHNKRSSGQLGEPSEAAAAEKGSAPGQRVRSPRDVPENPNDVGPELSINAFTTAITINDVIRAQMASPNDSCVSTESGEQGQISTASDWDRVTADSIRNKPSSETAEPSLTTYLVGIAALIVAGGAAISSH